jgi:DNA-binding transcriptional ArsR family regulator
LINRYDMAKLAKQIGIKGGNFLTRDMGEKGYELMKEQLGATPEGQPLVLIFPPAQLVDSSFADESAVRLSEEILKGEYGERCILLEGLTTDSAKNFRAVLSLRGIKLPLLAVEATGEWQILGGLEENLVKTLNLVHRHGRLTASELVSQLGLAVNTASTRLKRLHNLHLVRRESEVSERGLQYLYYFWQWDIRQIEE